MKDWRQVHLSQTRKERRALIADDVLSIEQFANQAKQKRYPAGSIYYWSLNSVFGPVGSAQENKNNAA